MNENLPDPNFLLELETLLKDRKARLPEGSYTAKLFQGDENQLLKKIVEEAGETVLAFKNGTENHRKEIVSETADLFFHIIVSLVQYDVPITEIIGELKKRHSR